MAGKNGFIYYIESYDGPIKIGFSVNPQFRLSTLQCASAYPLRVIYAQPGTLSDEKRLHRRFDDERLEGEWFNPTKRLLAHIELVKKQVLTERGPQCRGRE